MFQSEDGQCPPYLSLAYGLNDSWYVTFQTEEETQQAFFHLQTLGKTFNGKPVFVSWGERKNGFWSSLWVQWTLMSPLKVYETNTRPIRYL